MGDEEHEVNKTEVSADKVTDAGVDGLTMHIKVYAPFKVYFDGTANSISAVNDTGPFDILPKHHNFMTLLSAGNIIVRSDGGEETIKITRGIMHVKADDVVVFLDV
jgi:F0F1-type ATP synthase epsilon subunit